MPRTYRLSTGRAMGDDRRYLFAKIGTSDALACPQLSPGSIVRVDRCFAQRIRGVDHASTGDLFWLVEHTRRTDLLPGAVD